MSNVERYFTEGIAPVELGRWSGSEVETFFVMEDTGAPIPSEVTQSILTDANGGQENGALTYDLGRATLELRTDPQPTLDLTLEATQKRLQGLYGIAARYGAVPAFQPILEYDGDLLWIPGSDDPDAVRDQAFVQLDGQEALEELTRAASVQFTVSVPPEEAIDVMNTLVGARLQEQDYPNDESWRRYMAKSLAGYRPDRYGDPDGGYEDMEAYYESLRRQDVIMLDGAVCDPRLNIEDVPYTEARLTNFVRSVWKGIRLRVYDEPDSGQRMLAIEVRPISRRDDEKIARDLGTIRGLLNI